MRRLFTLVMGLALLGSAAPRAQAELLEYYVGIDSRPTMIGGAYDGLANPNYGRLTMLYAHTYTPPANNHYHGKSNYSYTGPANDPEIRDRPGSNWLPESGPPIEMHIGSGPFAGRMATQLYSDEPFNNLRLGSVNSLDGFETGSGEEILFNSSGGRYNTLLSDDEVWLEIVSLSPGLTVSNADGTQMLDSVGQYFNLGAGSAIDFTPVFLADYGPIQDYSATFVLRHAGALDGSLDSGLFEFRFRPVAVPEPGSLVLMGFGAAGLLVAGYRRRTKTRA